MLLPVLSLKRKHIEHVEFVNFWSNCHVRSKKDYLYANRIDNKSFTAYDISQFYKWKNGMEFKDHVKKNKTVKQVKSNLRYINNLKQNFDLQLFNERFSKMPAIWQIFLLHIIKPSRYPIFDQHVYRAHAFITKGVILEIPNSNKEKMKFYHSTYLPFFKDVKQNIKQRNRDIDLALLTFGKFLKTNYASKLVN